MAARSKYYIYKINEAPNSRTNNTTNLCLVKVSELTNLIEEDNDDESQNVDGNAENYVNFDSDAYINTLFTPNVDTNISINSSTPQSSKSVFKNLLEENDTKTTGLTNHSLNNMIKREELVDLVKNRLNNKYCITYIVIHSYYIKLLIKSIKDNTTHSMNCEVLTPEFTKCLLKLECIWSSMTNSTMNEVLTNDECKTIYETLVHYITHCYDDNSRDLGTQTFLNNYKNDYKKAKTTYTYYYDQAKIKLEKAQDDDFIKSHDFSFLNNGGVKYGINNVTHGHPIFLLLKITKKAIGSSINSTITFNLNSIVCMYNTCKFVCSDYNIFESIDSLAAIYVATRRYKKAEELYVRRLAILKKTSDPEHLDVAATLYKMAPAYRRQGKFAKAAKFLKQARVIYEKNLGPDHMFIVQTIKRQANLYQSIGMWQQAAPFMKEARAMKARLAKQQTKKSG